MTCRCTPDTLARFGTLLLALLGFAAYFFYDASSGYYEKNANYYAYQAFANGGAEASQMSAAAWHSSCENTPLISTTPDSNSRPVVLEKSSKSQQIYPLPYDIQATKSCPAEFRDHAMMSRAWSDAWIAYSGRMHYEVKPHKAYDVPTIQEQWVAGGVCLVLAAILLFFTLRTMRRVLSIDGDCVTVAGQQFKVADVTSLDLRQWSPGFKGYAIFQVKGKRLKADGLTYGGFEKKNSEPAEQFMQAFLAQYHGEIVEYAPADSNSKS